MPIWERIGRAKENNCTEFAFQGEDSQLQFGFSGDLEKLVAHARRCGWRETSNIREAIVILYGDLRGGLPTTYTHAIRRVGDHWEEVYGDNHNIWRDPMPFAWNRHEPIVSMLVKIS